MVIDLIEKFMEAGFLPDTALRMMNSAMVTHGENNLFSTVDLMRLELDSGIAEFYKIGAAVTFIRMVTKCAWWNRAVCRWGCLPDRKCRRSHRNWKTVILW